jgi:hypothetical protein
MASGAPSGRHPIREFAILGWHILRNWLLPGRKSMVPYSIQWLMRLKPAWFCAQRLPLCQARHAHELLESGGVIGKIRADTERVAEALIGT